MADCIMISVTALFSCFFLTDKISMLCRHIFGFPGTWIWGIVCALAAAGIAVLAHRKHVLALLGRKRIYLIAAQIFGIIIVFTGSGVFGVSHMLSKIGAGVLLGLYIFICAACISKIRPHIPRLNTSLLLFLLCTMVIVNFAGAVYVSQSAYIYYWDNAIYWTFAREIADGSMSNGFFTDLYYSIIHFDYNYLAALLSALFAKLFGDSRTIYILSILNCYYIPICAAVYCLCRKGKHPILTASVTLLSFPAVLFLGLAGFVDIAGLLVCLLCFWLYFSKKQTFARAFALGLLLAVTILLRRWYAFFTVSFLAAMLADIFISKRSPLYLITAFVHVGFILMTFFGEFVTGKLLADYASLYAGYQFSLSVDFKLIFRYFGIIPLALISAGSIWLIVKKDRRPCFALLQMITCFFLFARTQTHGQQHLLLYIPALMFLTVLILQSMHTRFYVPALLLAVCISANTLIDRPQPAAISEIRSYALFADFSMRPRIRTDAKQILALKAYLDNLAQDGSKIGVLASSFILNKDILDNVEASFQIKDTQTRDYFLELPAVDSRDHDFSAFYAADYIVAASPVQTHLAPENQCVVTVPAESFINHTDIALAYEKLDAEFMVQDVTVAVYRRTRENTLEERTAFEQRLQNAMFT